MFTFVFRLAVSLLCLGFAVGPAQAQRSMSDEQIVLQAQRVARGERIEIFQHGIEIEGAKLLRLAEEAYRSIEKITGLQLDTATLGPRIQIVVSASAGVSHVWHSYNHPRQPRGVIFLNALAYRGAIKGSNATYIHEMTHLFTWNYHSHTLREGLADWVALAVLPDAGVGPNPNGHDPATVIQPIIADYLGTTKPPPDWLQSDAQMRSAYYYASYRFVKHMIERKGLATFMMLYNSSTPETAMVMLYQVARDTAIREAGF